MSLILLPLQESHISAFTRISRNAFADARDVNNRLLYPKGPTPELHEAYERITRDAFHNTRNIVFLGIFDFPGETPVPSTSEDLSADLLIAGARIRLEDPGTAAEPEKKRPPPPGCNVAAHAAFFGGIGAARKEVMGPKTYWNLDLLCTETKHQGRGAGTMILRWIFDRAAKTKAEETGEVSVECFVEATNAGKSLYEKMGYRHVRKLEWKGSDFGADVDGVIYVMVRPAEKAPRTNGH